MQQKLEEDRYLLKAEGDLGEPYIFDVDQAVAVTNPVFNKQKPFHLKRHDQTKYMHHFQIHTSQHIG